MSEVGTVDAVRLETLGSALSADAAVGAATITVDDLADFSEDGGWLLLSDQALQYTAGDDTTGVITLASALTVAGAAADRVDVYVNGGRAAVLYADVWLGDADDTVECLVPMTLRDRVAEGMESGLAVEVDTSGPEFVLMDVRGSDPVIDGSYISPDTTIDPAALTDGLPPATPPQNVQASAFAILAGRITWERPANPDPLTYRVYVSDTAGVDSSDELARTTASLSAVVDAFGGAPLDPAKTYFSVVYADDADGPGPASAEVSFTPRQADESDISANYVYAGQVQAAQIASGVADADIAVAGSLYVSDYDPDTGLPIDGTVKWQVDSDGSQRMWDADGNEILTADPNTRSFAWRGKVQSSEAEFEGAVLRGLTELAQGGTTTLEKGITAPKSAPSATIDYSTTQFDQFPAASGGLASDGTNWYSTLVSAGVLFVKKWNASGVFQATSQSVSSLLVAGTSSVAYNGTDLYVLAQTQTGAWKVYRVTTALAVSGSPSTWADNSGSRKPAIGWDSSASEILIAQSRSTGFVRVKRYTFNAGGNLTASGTAAVDSAFAFAQDLSSVLFGSFDMGGSRYLFSRAGAAGEVKVMSTGGVEQSGDEFQSSAVAVGMRWDGTNFRSLDSSGVLRLYEGGAGNKWTAAADENWYAAYTWDTGSAQTLRGPYTALTMKKRARLTVTVPPAPAGVSSGRVYLKKGTTNPGATATVVNMRSNGNTTAGVLTVVSADFGTSDNPSSSGVGTGTAHLVKDGDGNELLSADSVWTAYTPVWTAASSNPSPGNATLTGRWKRVGRIVEFQITLTTGSTTTNGSGGYRFTLPVAAQTSQTGTAVGSALFNPVSGTVTGFTVGLFSSTQVMAWASGPMSAANPMAAATGDLISLRGTYEAA